MNWKRLIGWLKNQCRAPWQRHPSYQAMETRWESDPFYAAFSAPSPLASYLGPDERTKAQKLADLAAARVRLGKLLAKAKAQKKARKHIYAALEANTRERLRIEGGE